MVSPKDLAQILILTGTTASGKTVLSIELAKQVGGVEIINADSLLVYRQMDVGTAKPSEAERKGVVHHLIDIRDPDQPFTAGDFVRCAESRIESIFESGKRPLIVGGTGFYLKALLYGLWGTVDSKTNPELRKRLELRTNLELFEELKKSDPESALRIGPNDRYRLIRSLELIALSGKNPTELQSLLPKEPDPRFVLFVVDRENKDLYARISKRTHSMLESGLVDEVKSLKSKYPSARALNAVGYAQVSAYLEGKAPSGRKISPGMTGLQSEIELATRQLVKRQRTWFRGQKEVKWFTLDRDLIELTSEFHKIYART